MKVHSRSLFLAAASLVSLASPALAQSPVVPDNIAAPKDHVVRVRLQASGVQIYECRSGEGGAFQWAFVAPEAALSDESGKPLGKHFAGPTWEATDGSRIGGKLIAKAPSPDGKSIPWLLLQAAQQQAGATFAGVDLVQRIDTSGGSAPAEGCGAGTLHAQARIPYTARYVFLAPGS